MSAARHKKDREREPDARLAAAAPDMLAELKRARLALSMLDPCPVVTAAIAGIDGLLELLAPGP